MGIINIDEIKRKIKKEKDNQDHMESMMESLRQPGVIVLVEEHEIDDYNYDSYILIDENLYGIDYNLFDDPEILFELEEDDDDE